MTKYTNSFDAYILCFILHVYIALTLEKRNQSSFTVKYFKKQTSKCCSLKAEKNNLNTNYLFIFIRDHIHNFF